MDDTPKLQTWMVERCRRMARMYRDSARAGVPSATLDSEVADEWEAVTEVVEAALERQEQIQPDPDVRAMQKLEMLARDGACPCLVYDDFGHWALSVTGAQPLCEQPSEIIVFTDGCRWRSNPADAVLDAHEEEET